MPRALALLILPVIASVFCKYTVRDVAFVDLGDEPYRLIVGTGDDAVIERAAALISDSNVRIEGARDRNASGTAILVAPDGRRLALDRNEWPAAVVDSPARRRLLAAIAARYAVVLRVEGGRTEDDRQAENVTERAFVRLQTVWHTMPKDVGEPPAEVVVRAADRHSERVLLWSLGLEPDAGPAVAVVFGRGRRVGTTLRGAAIREAALFEILANCGRSCECDLDRSWMRGTRLPLRWDDAQRRLCARLLGFDPDSPLVRIEVGSILARGGGNGSTRLEAVIDGGIGYSEEPVAGPDPMSPDPDPGSAANTVTAIVAVLCVSLLGGIAITVRSRNR